MKPLFYSALFGSGLLIGMLVSHQSLVDPATAASGATKYDCIGFDSDDNGRGIVTIYNPNDKGIGGKVRWYNDRGDEVGDDDAFDLGDHESTRENKNDKGIVRASVKADGPILVDGRLQSDKTTVSVKCVANPD